MHRLSALALLLALAACATPQQRCVAQATEDLRIVERLIAQTRLNIDRGYGVREQTQVVSDWDWCQPQGYVRDRNGDLRPLPPRICDRDRTITRRYPVALDLGAEERKLQSLEAKRRELSDRAEREVAQCQALYPR